MKTIAEQLGFYDAYHRNPWNKATHFVGIPAIIFALLLLLSWLGVTAGGITVTAAMVFTVAVMAYYVALDRVMAGVMVVLIGPLLFAAHQTAQWPWQQGLAIFLATFVGGWILQLIGHTVFEKRRPAFTDNLIQLLIGPLFFAAEILFFLGFKRDLQAEVRRLSVLAGAPG
jgi:uncharacterized membrane protein YGL010W